MAVVGYARVSTADQNLDLQLDALKQAGASPIYEEHCSGGSAERPELHQCIRALRQGDTLAVWRLDRLGRNLRDLIQIVSDLEAKGVAFRSLRESIDTAGPAGKLVFHLFASLAEFERELLRERTNSGLVAARARGRKGGRPSVLTATEITNALSMMRDPQIPVREICRLYKISRSTLYNYASGSSSSTPKA